MKPMLAATCLDTSTVRYPVLASPKLDGIRAIVQNGQLVSRNFKTIRNAHTFAQFSQHALDGFDGELICGPHDDTVFRRTTSGVRRAMGTPDVEFWVFDVQIIHTDFQERYTYLAEQVDHWRAQGVKLRLVPHVWIHHEHELKMYEEKCLNEGYEGIMLRSPTGLYKEGRSTVNEGWLLKVKRFSDAEAEIIGFEERMHNGNEATTDALGRTERSSHAENMVGRGDLGAFIVKGVNGVYANQIFNIGTGFDDHDRAIFWSNKEALMGKTVKYKYFPMGSKDAPRFPVFLGMRELGT